MKEKIVKLINSGNKEDIILGMHLLGNFKWEEICNIFQNNFRRVSSTLEYRYFYRECAVCAYFWYEGKFIYVGHTLITLDNIIWREDGRAFSKTDKIIVR